ncbi:MAG TPA: hypothetical protein VJ486_04150 [Geothrix sp.]|nr:hypothetical protein [Geothrix sp.]
MKTIYWTAMESDARPTTIHTNDPEAPRPPWAFLRGALPGGFTRWGWGLMLGWGLVLLGPVMGWAGHLRRLAGWSALPSHWGEGISARDVWELYKNGGLEGHLVNSPTVHLLGMGLIIVLWCGWRMQAETAGMKARLSPWLLGALDTLLIGLLPILLVTWGLDRILAWAGDTGLPSLGWIAMLGRPLLWMATLSTLNVQWWLCRLGRLRGFQRGYGRHLAECFLQVWGHPVQWGLLAAGGALLRSTLPFLVILLAWRLGGITVFRVFLFILLQWVVVLANGWLMGWLLRATALFSNHDAVACQARASLKELPREAQPV